MIRRFGLIAAAAGMLALSACVPTDTEPAGNSNASVQQPNDTAAGTTDGVGSVVVLNATKGLVLAEYGFNSVAQGAKAALEVGALKGENATRVAVLTRTGFDLLEKGKNAKTDAERVLATNSLLGVIDELTGLVPANFLKR